MKNKWVFLVFLLAFFVEAHSQTAKVTKPLCGVVFLCDTTQIDLEVTMVDNTFYLHLPNQGPMSTIDPNRIQNVDITKLSKIDKDKCIVLDKYRKKIKSDNCLRIVTKKNK